VVPAVVLAALVLAGPAARAAGPASPAPAGALAPSGDPSGPLAGSRAGEGRPHPGWEADEQELFPGRGDGPAPGERDDGPAALPDPYDPGAADDRDGPGYDPRDEEDPPGDDAPGGGPWDDDGDDGEDAGPGDPYEDVDPPDDVDGPGDGLTVPAPHDRTPRPVRTAPGTGGPDGTVPRADGPAASAVPVVTPSVAGPLFDRADGRSPGQALRILPLGTGLALLGCGIGVIALRLRRH